MDILSVSILHGPNVRARVSVLEAAVNCRDWTNLTNDALDGCERKLSEWLTGLPVRRAARGLPIRPDVPSVLAAAEMLSDVVLELQTVSGTRVTCTRLDYGRADLIDEAGQCRIVVQFEEEQLARACLEAACRFCVSTLNGGAFDASAEVQRLVELGERVCLGWTNGPIVAAARERGIPWCRLDDRNLVQLGQGARRRRIMPAVTDRTSTIAEAISVDKERTKRLLRELGIPVPEGRTAATAEEAWAAACEVGLPVAIKPRDSDFGQGVSLNLRTRDQVAAAVASASQFSKQFVVEQFIAGDQFRLTVIGERLVAAIRRDSPRLVGDGRLSIRELIEAANLDPRRGPADDRPLAHIQPDTDTPDVLAEQGLDLDSIPPAGTVVTLSRIAHTWAGAGVTDVTDSVNSELAAQVVSAVRLIGLDIAGVDMVARDITRGLDEQGGAILEINAWPALSLHFQPFCPVFRPICESIIESLFPAGETSRIPLVVVTGGGDNLAIGRQLVRLLRVGGGRIGWASSEGLSLEGRRIKSGSQACLVGNRALLLSPDVEVAVLERSLEGIRREGLGLDQCDVAVVSRLGDVPPTDDLVQAARVLVESVPHGGAVVLDADDPALEALLEVAPATSILVAMSGEHPLIRSAKRSAVFLHNGDVVLRDGHGAEQVIAMSSPQRSASDAGAPPRELLMALAAAWAGRVPVEMIAKEMQRFGPG